MFPLILIKRNILNFYLNQIYNLDKVKKCTINYNSNTQSKKTNLIE